MVDGGTDYTLANSTISAVYYSNVKVPYGFPLDPNKWTLTYTDTSVRSQSSPVSGTVYNINSAALSIDIGLWYVSFSLLASSILPAGDAALRASLSTSNSTENLSFLASERAYANARISATLSQQSVLNLTTKTTYYLNLVIAATSPTSLSQENATQTLFIKAVCAYL